MGKLVEKGYKFPKDVVSCYSDMVKCISDEKFCNDTYFSSIKYPTLIVGKLKDTYASEIASILKVFKGWVRPSNVFGEKLNLFIEILRNGV